MNIFSAKLVLSFDEAIKEFKETLEKNKGNYTHTARDLGLSMSTLHRIRRKYNL